uniref:PhoD-like phosphatase N-terminal domain-containing protein n=1 Tax=Phenylobacterium glaciei TaxID=2803784 RepID=A0A974S7G0_9CAUL|nr:PhoD-like phosphatase N-terminal domain-containing protein [Phenylobacterium glaciei]
MPPEPVAVRWEIAEDQAMRKLVRSGKALAAPNAGHSVHVEVAGLKAGREYWYRFTAAGAQSPVGRTRTAPARARKWTACASVSHRARSTRRASTRPTPTWWRRRGPDPLPRRLHL